MSEQTPNQIIAANVRRIRKVRGISAQDLADQMAALGSDMTRSILTNFENGRVAEIGVNRLAHFAEALKVEPWTLATLPEPVCVDCRNAPPPGFGCNTCGMRTAK